MNTIQDALNRGYNLLCISIISLAGFAFLPEAFLEKDVADKGDDSGLFLIGLIGILWYFWKNNRTKRSVMPLLLVWAAGLVKIAGLIIEFTDPESAGDDFGGVILFALAVGLVTYQYFATKKLLANAQPVV